MQAGSDSRLATLRSEKGGPEGAEDTSGVEKSKMNVNKESEIGDLNERLRILNFTLNEVVKQNFRRR